ncbi:MAG: diaminopimelate epimerase [Leptospirales bacterium]|nr:diaminopimelate epimerase [Leptospirales bacterium]
MSDWIEFVKMEGTGNDYLFLDTRRVPAPAFSPAEISFLSDRRRGVGGDGLVLIGPSARAAGRMQMWNADGSSSAMCGNALRCIALYLARDLGCDDLTLESDVGLHQAHVDREHNQARVQLPPPSFAAQTIPFLSEQSDAPLHLSGPLITATLQAAGRNYEALLVSMGNPHAVIFVEDVEAIAIEEIGPLLENHRAFPQRCNIEFVQTMGYGEFRQRTWERGSGETLACGSGACAVHVAASLSGRSSAESRIALRGGELRAAWNPEARSEGVWLSGEVRRCFEGRFDLPALRSSAASAASAGLAQ